MTATSRFRRAGSAPGAVPPTFGVRWVAIYTAVALAVVAAILVVTTSPGSGLLGPEWAGASAASECAAQGDARLLAADEAQRIDPDTGLVVVPMVGPGEEGRAFLRGWNRETRRLVASGACPGPYYRDRMQVPEDVLRRLRTGGGEAVADPEAGWTAAGLLLRLENRNGGCGEGVPDTLAVAGRQVPCSRLVLVVRDGGGHLLCAFARAKAWFPWIDGDLRFLVAADARTMWLRGATPDGGAYVVTVDLERGTVIGVLPDGA